MGDERGSGQHKRLRTLLPQAFCIPGLPFWLLADTKPGPRPTVRDYLLELSVAAGCRGHENRGFVSSLVDRGVGQLESLCVQQVSSLKEKLIKSKEKAKGHTPPHSPRM